MNNDKNIYKKYTTGIRVTREIQRLLKDLRKNKGESINDVLTNILIEAGYLKR